MDIETARIVLAVITAAGALIWLIGLRFLIASARRRAAAPPEVVDGTDPDTAGREDWLTGSAEVEGEPGDLASRAAAVLASSFGTVKVVEKTDDRVRFQWAGVTGRGSGQWFHQGELRFVPLRSGRTRVEWAVEPANMRGLLWAGGVVLAAGFVALAAGCWAIDTYLASSPNPAIRWQTLQMLQAIHFLWPPFLFGALYRRGASIVAAQFDALAHNLPFHGG